MAKDIDFSAIITAHHEGLIAHKTILSVFEAVEEVEKAGYTYEIIIHIDNGDKETIEYFERYQKRKDIRIFQNKFGDLGESRNFAAKEAKGEFVAFLDADDLISPNWFKNGLEKIAKSDKKILVHPEAILNFGIKQPNVLHIQKDYNFSPEDVTLLIGENRWCSVIMGERDIFINYQYKRMEDGYGYEDYLLNVETLSDGIVHVVAPETVLFYRRSNSSMLTEYNSNKRILQYNKLFDFSNFQNEQYQEKAKKETLKTKGYRIYKKIRNNDKLNLFITPVAKIVLRILDRQQPKRSDQIPKFVIDAWENINHIETQLYPQEQTIKKVIKYSPGFKIAIGQAYVKVAQYITKKPNYIFVVPWLVPGGAEKVLLNYIKAILDNKKDQHITVIATLPVKHVWRDKLPEGVDFIDFGNISSGLPPDDQDVLFSRIITQLQCKRLHIINSEYGYLWAISHKELVKAHYQLDVSFFCNREYIPETNLKGIFSYGDPYLLEIHPVVRCIFTDNKTVIDDLIAKNGFDSEKFKVLYQPNQDILRTYMPTKNKIKHILWASRVTYTKMPNIIAQVGKLLDPKKFVIDVYGGISPEVSQHIFDQIPAIKYHGPFNGFSSIPIEDKDLFLYTSLTDGLPNTILEATAAGLPIIASNDGGVGEFIQNGKTGILIKDYLQPEAYIKAIKKYINDTDKLESNVQNAQKLLKTRHSWDKFIESVKKNLYPGSI